jgi:hypothetical protein
MPRFRVMGDRDAIEHWDLDRLSRFLGDVEVRHQEQLRVQEQDGMWIAELLSTSLSSGPSDDMEGAMRELAYLAFDRDRPDG